MIAVYIDLTRVFMFKEFIKRVGERDKMLGLPIILSLFRNEFNKFNNKRTHMIDSFWLVPSAIKRLNFTFKIHLSRST